MIRLPLTLALVATSLLVLAPASGLAESGGILGVLTPELSPDGANIAFSYQGDIWTVGREGGRAHRLTDHPSYDANPVWSDDGTELAFSSNRRGNFDLYRIRVSGGQPDRLTYAAFDDIAYDWRGDQVLFGSARDLYSVDLYTITVPESGAATALEHRLTYDKTRLQYGRFSPDGSRIALTRGNTGWTRKEYLGSADQDIAVMDADGRNIRTLTGTGTAEGDTLDAFAVWQSDDTLLFISDRDEWGKNLYRISQAGGPPTKLTDFTNNEDGAAQLTASADGQWYAFTVAGQLYTMAVDGTPQPITVRVEGELKRDTLSRIPLGREVTEYAIAPNGKHLAAVSRGDILIVPINDPEEPAPLDSPRFGEAWNCTDNVWRDFEVAWHPDGDRIVYSSDEDGDWELFVMDLNTRERTQLTHDDVAELQATWSPDGTRLAYLRGNRELVVANADGSNPKVVARAFLVFGGIFRGTFAWSPDSQWIAFEDLDDSWSSDLYIVPADGSAEPRNVTRFFSEDSTPHWSSDGQYLYFASDRGSTGDLDPRGSNIYRLQLSRRPPPFSDEMSFGKDDDASDDDAEEGDEDESSEGADGSADDSGDEDSAETDKENEEDDEKVERVKIDFTDIDLRVEQVSGTAGSVHGGALSPDGEWLVYAATPLGKTSLYAVRTIDGETRQLAEHGGTDITFSADGKVLYHSDGDGISALKFSDGEGTGGGAVPISATKDLDVNGEFQQMYREAWRSLRDGFYDPSMHGVDWDAIYTKYEPLAFNIGTREEFYVVVSLMLGELHASHLGIFGPGSFEGIGESGASLGLDFDEDYSGVGMRVKRVLWRGPTAIAESRVLAGETVLAINGATIDRDHSWYPLLENQAYRTVKLTVRAADGTEREVKVWPTDLGTEGNLRYDQWVEDNRLKVEADSGGTLGYIHIRGMNQPSLHLFYRELYSRLQDKEGLVLDIRFNGGGNTHEQLLDALDRPVLGLAQIREGERRVQPTRRWGKPTVLLINERSASDSEIFPNGFREQQLGTIIGRPTGGFVIGTLNYPLIDGATQFRIPLMGWWTSEGINLENYGVPPDIYLENDPNGYRAGADAQLDRAIAECGAMVERGWRVR